MSFFYVSTDKVTDETLEFLGYYKVAEDDEFILYNHKGDEIIVSKADRMIKVDDWNDAVLIGSEVVQV